MAISKIEKGQPICRAGDALTELFVIGEGSVQATFPGGTLLLSQGDIIGICEKKIVAKSQNVADATLDTIRKIAKDKDMLTLYYGKDVSDEDANALIQKVTEEFDWLETACYPGGQPHYYYIISAE